MTPPSGDITDPHIVTAIVCLSVALVVALIGLVNVIPKDQRRPPPSDTPIFPPF